MAKRKDPAVLVVRYFQTAEINQAMLVLSLARDAVNSRKPPKEGTTVKPARASRKAAPAATAIGGVALPPAPPAPLAGR